MTRSRIDPSVVANEFAEAPLPDARLVNRLETIARSLAVHPSGALAPSARSSAALEGAYRFMNNSRVTFDPILEPHLAATTERVIGAGSVLVLHDTTKFKFDSGKDFDFLGYLPEGARGFMGHFSLALESKSLKPLGLLGARTLFREKPPAKRGAGGGWKARQSSARYALKPDKESRRWGDQVTQVEERVAGRAALIHVMDSEADSYALLAKMVAAKQRFVVRLARERRARAELGEVWGSLTELIAGAADVAIRDVQLSARKAADTKLRVAKRNAHGREARSATLHFAAKSLQLRRPQNVTEDPADLSLNIVRVYEPNSPSGEEPVEWVLLTNESIEDRAAILKVVDCYRARWVIEEYFKALKTGCAYRKAELESRDGLLNLLAVTIPIAWQMLLVRSVARAHPDSSAAGTLSPSELQVLRSLFPKRIDAAPTMERAFLAIAELGGHHQGNGPPGWLVLYRGLQRLSAMVEGFELARATAEEM